MIGWKYLMYDVKCTIIRGEEQMQTKSHHSPWTIRRPAYGSLAVSGLAGLQWASSVHP